MRRRLSWWLVRLAVRLDPLLPLDHYMEMTAFTTMTEQDVEDIRSLRDFAVAMKNHLDDIIGPEVRH